MAADALITKGLELFASGDLTGAARIWLTAKKEGGRDPQLDAYLEHIKAMTGEVYAAIESELGMTPVVVAVPEPAPTPVQAPINAVVFDPVAPPPTARSTPLPLPLPTRRAVPPSVSTRSFAPVAAPAPPALRITPPPAPPATPAPVLFELDYGGSTEPIFDDPALAPPEPPAPPPTVSLPQLAAPLPPTVEPLPVVVPPPPVPVVAGPWGGDAVLGPPMEVTGPGGGLDLVAAKGKPVEPIAVPRGELAREETKLKERLGLDDFTGALDLAERLLKSNPQHPLALAARERCRTNLEQIYSSKLGSLSLSPKVLIPPEQVIWLDLDHRTGFLLAQVDGLSSYEDLIELSGMDRLEALRLMAQLIQKGVIGPG